MIFLKVVLPSFFPSISRNSAPHDMDPLNLYASPCARFPNASRMRTRTVVFSHEMKVLEEGVTSIFTGRAGRTVIVVNHFTPPRSMNSKRYIPDFERSAESRNRYSFFMTFIGSRSRTLLISSYTMRV